MLEKVGLNDYRIKLPKGPKLLHGNLLKVYVERKKEGEQHTPQAILEGSSGLQPLEDPAEMLGAVIEMG